MMNEALIEIRDVIRTAVGSAATSFYAGDVGLPYKTSLPAVIVRELYTQAERPSTAKDSYRFGISVLVVVDHVKDLSAAAGLTDSIVAHRQRLRLLVEEADTDGAPKTTTVLGALMKQANLRGTYYTYSLNPRVNYQPTAPQGFYLVAAEITLELLVDFVTRKA